MEAQPRDQGGEVVDFSKRRAERDKKINASMARHPAGSKREVRKSTKTTGEQEPGGGSPDKKGQAVLRAAEVELTDETDD